jgi:hypothetical protein
VFSEEAAKAPNTLKGAEHAIDLVDGKEPPQGTIYPLSPRQLEELARYLQENLANGRIVESNSPAGAPIIFVPKKDGSMRLCVDYRGLNKVTIKNRYPLPLISELMDRLSGARFFTKLDLRDAYHRIRIRPTDRWKTAFKTRYGQFEYTVMPFGLTNAPATFQAYINRALAGLLDVFCIVYLDDILIYSRTREEHTTHILQVLDRLEQFQLFAKQSKCSFYQDRVEFLGFIISRDGISMDPERVKAIEEWPPPESIHDIQVFLGFANFYRRFIEGYSRITAPITALLKGGQTTPFHWTEPAAAAFAQLKSAFSLAGFLAHWEPQRLTRVETDASNKAISGILSQQIDSQWRPVAYWSRKLTDAELRWATGQKELLAIIESLEHWSHYLEGTDRKFIVLTDHEALKGVVAAPARDLRGRLARWVYRLAGFDFDIEHRPGKTNPADPLSRRPDYMAGEITYEDVLPTLAKKLQMTEDLSRPVTATIARIGAGEFKEACSQKYHMTYEDVLPTLAKKLQMTEDLSRPVTATLARIRAGEFKKACSRKYRRAVRRQCPRVDGEARVTAVTRFALGVSGREAFVKAELRERATGGAAAPSGGGLGRCAGGTDSPGRSVSLGRSSQRVEEQSQQGARCADLLIPHAVAAEVCAGEAVDANPSYRFYKSVIALQRGDVGCRIRIDAVLRSHACLQRNSLNNGSGGNDEGCLQNHACPKQNGLKNDSVDDEGALRFKGRLVIPPVPAVRRELVRLHHDDPRAGHFGSGKTIELLKRRFHWENLDSDV